MEKLSVLFVLSALLISVLMPVNSIYAETPEVTMELPEGWSMISVPVRSEVATLRTLFPEAVVVYQYQKGKGYVRVQEGDNLEVGMGYWILLDEPQSYVIRGKEITEYTIPVEDGWYMIGGCTSLAQVVSHGCDIGVIYSYIPETGYERVPESQSLEPCKGYWILLNNVSDQAKISVEVEIECPLDVLEQYGDGIHLTDDTLSKAIRRLGDKTCILVLSPGIWTIANDISVPDNFILSIPFGAKFNLDSSTTLTLEGFLEANAYHIFQGEGTVVFKGSEPRTVYPQWWGAVGNGITDDSQAFQKAQAAIEATGGTIFVPFSSSGYMLGDGATAGTAIAIASNTQWIGENTKLIHQAIQRGPLLFSADDLKDATSLAVKLRDASDPLSLFFQEQFSSNTRQLLSEYDDSDPPSESLQDALINELNQLLQGSSLYDEDRFAHVTLSEETQLLIAQSPEGEDLIRLNRLLLEDAYPDEIAKSRGQSQLFRVEDVTNVLIKGFVIDGGKKVRNGITLCGAVENIILENLELYDLKNFAIQYADTDTNPETAYFNNVHLDNIKIHGKVGAVGEGAGLIFFPRAFTTINGEDAPISMNLYLNNIHVDVSQGERDENHHGPQCIKIQNTDGVYMNNIMAIGGNIQAIVITTGSRNVYGTNIHTHFANRGMQLGNGYKTQQDDKQQYIINPPIAHATTRVNITNFTYDPEDVKNADKYGVIIRGDPRQVSLSDVDIIGDFVFTKDTTEGAGNDLDSMTLNNIILREGDFIIRNPSVDTPDVKGLQINHLTIYGGGKKGRIITYTHRGISNSLFENVTFYETKNHAIIIKRGEENVFENVRCYNGNPDNLSTSAILRDCGNKNSLINASLIGPHHMQYFVQKVGGSGLLVQSLFGTTTNSAGVDLRNQELSMLPQGDRLVSSGILDLSAAPIDERVFEAEEDYFLLGIQILYTEGASPDTGVVIRVGNHAANDTYLSENSEVNKPAHYTKNYINTVGVDSFPVRKLDKGDYLTIGTAGNKNGDGKIKVFVSLVRRMSS